MSMEQFDLVSGSIDFFGPPLGAAMDFFKLIFGGWVCGLWGGDCGGESSLFTNVAGYMNYLALLLLAIFAGISITFSVLKTASTGNLGDGKSNVLLVLKFLLPLLMVQPFVGNPNVSGVQAATLYLAGLGSNGADKTAYLISSETTKKAMAVGENAGGYKVIADLTKMAFCTHAINESIPEFTSFENQPYAWNGSSHVSLNQALSSSPLRLQIGQEGKCGAIEVVSDDQYAKDIFSEKVVKLSASYLQKIFNEVVVPLEGTNYYTMKNNQIVQREYGSETNSALDKASTNFVKLVEQYDKDFGNLVKDSLNELAENKESGLEVIIDENDYIYTTISPEAFAKTGWTFLGAYYTKMSTSTSQVHDKLNIARSITQFKMSESEACGMERGGLISKMAFWRDEPCKYMSEFPKASLVIGRSNDKVIETSTNYANKADAACTSTSDCNPDAVVNNIKSMLGSSLIAYGSANGQGVTDFSKTVLESLTGSDSFGLNVQENRNGDSVYSPTSLKMTDAIAVTSSVGHRVAYSTGIARTVIHGMRGVADAIGDSALAIVGLGGLLGGVLNSIANYLDQILSVIQYSALAMAYFIPNLGALIWIVAVKSWQFMVMVAFLVSPLSVVLLAKPEFHGTSGFGFEKFANLIYALVLTPTLLCAGLYISKLLMDIGFMYFNQMFWLSQASNIMSYDIMSISFTMLVWFAITAMLLHSSYKIIPETRDVALTWLAGMTGKFFGGSVESANVDRLADVQNQASQDVGRATQAKVSASIRNKMNKSDSE